MNGSAIRRICIATAAAVVLVATLGACDAVTPNAGATPSPSVVVSETPTPQVTATVTVTTTASSSPSPSATGSTLGPLTGAWKGTWINETPTTAVGTFTLTWAQQGNQLFGAIGIQGSNCLSAGNVTGDVDGTKLTFGAVEGGNMITYTGTVSGNSMSGTYASACGNSKGTWTAIRG